MAKDLTCQNEVDMQALEDRHKELEKAWNDLLKEKRELHRRKLLSRRDVMKCIANIRIR